MISLANTVSKLHDLGVPCTMTLTYLIFRGLTANPVMTPPSPVLLLVTNGYVPARSGQHFPLHIDIPPPELDPHAP